MPPSEARRPSFAEAFAEPSLGPSDDEGLADSVDFANSALRRFNDIAIQCQRSAQALRLSSEAAARALASPRYAMPQEARRLLPSAVETPPAVDTVAARCHQIFLPASSPFHYCAEHHRLPMLKPAPAMLIAINTPAMSCRVTMLGESISR